MRFSRRYENYWFAPVLSFPRRRAWVFTPKKVQIQLQGRTNKGQTLGFHPRNLEFALERAPSQMQSTSAATPLVRPLLQDIKHPRHKKKHVPPRPSSSPRIQLSAIISYDTNNRAKLHAMP
jgi:hypothetical protein